MVITNPFYWPRVFDKKVVISATSNQQRVVVSFPLNDVRFHLDGDCLRIILFFFFSFFLIVRLAALNGVYISFGSRKKKNLIKTSDLQ